MPEEPQPAIEPTSEVTEPQVADNAAHQAASTDTAVAVSENEEGQESGSSEETSAARRNQQRLPLVLLSAATVLLVLVGALLGFGYVSAKDDLAEREIALTKRTTERDRITAQLASERTQRAELEVKLRTAESTAIDPTGYALVKVCVETHAQTEELMKQLAANPQGVTIREERFSMLVPAEGGFLVPNGPTPCLDSKPYLK